MKRVLTTLYEKCQWGGVRNKNVIRDLLNKECLYMYSISRNASICFKGEVLPFTGNLLILVPKTEMERSVLERNMIYLNSVDFKGNYMYSGRFKIGQSQFP